MQRKSVKMDIESPTPLLVEEEEEEEEQQEEVLELLPHMLQDSGYMVEFNDSPTSIYYMNPEVYLKLLRGPTRRERLYYKWMTLSDIIWKIFHPWAKER